MFSLLFLMIICSGSHPELKFVQPVFSKYLKKSYEINGDESLKNFLQKFLLFSIVEIVEIFILKPVSSLQSQKLHQFQRVILLAMNLPQSRFWNDFRQILQGLVIRD